MQTFVERELKLESPADFVLPPLEGEPLEGRLFTSTYYDTPARSLARAGLTLRRRVENGLSNWQLKLPREDGRAEVSAPGGPAGPPAALRALLLAHLRHGELERVATLRTRRTGVRVGSGEHPVADVTLDSVDILDGQKGLGGFVEIEIELVDGEIADLELLGRRLRKAGAKRSDGRAKVLRVLQISDAKPPGAKASTLDQVRHLLAAQLRELDRYDPGVRLRDDPEDVHRFRVATRRTRAVIRATRPLLGDVLAPLGTELNWLGEVLGPVRDLDVLVGHLRAGLGELGEDRPGGEAIVAALEEERERARDALLEALSSDRYLVLLDAFAIAIASLPDPGTPGSVRPIAAAAFRTLSKAARSLPSDAADGAVHALRIKAKRARYAAELAALAGAGKRTRRYIDALKDLQDVIGEHQDAVVAEERIRSLARGAAAVAGGRLIEREHARRNERRNQYPAVLARVMTRGREALGRT